MAIIVLVTSPAFAVPAPIAISAQVEDSSATEIDDSATALARLLYSREQMAVQLGRILAESLPQSMKNASDFGIYEAEYPGLIAAVVTALKPVMLKAYDNKMPLLWTTTSQIYREKFSSAELEQMIVFFKSPVGKRFTNAVESSIDTQTFMDAAVAAGGELTDGVTTAKRKADAAAVKKTNGQMSAADKIAIFRFENSSLGPKLTAVGPLISQAVIEWDYSFTDEQKQEFLTVRQATISEFIAKADAQKQAIDTSPASTTPANQ